MQLLKCAHQPPDDRLDIGDDADRAGAGRGARAIEIEPNLLAHEFGLFANLSREARARRIGLVDEHAQRRFQRMGEIADLSAGPLNDLAIGVDELVHLHRKWRHILRELACDMLGFATADRGYPVVQRAQRPQTVADSEPGRADQRKRERKKRRRKRPFETALLRLDHVGVGRDLDEVAPLVACVDLALDHSELAPAGSDDVAAQNIAMVRIDRHEVREVALRTATSTPGSPADLRPAA